MVFLLTIVLFFPIWVQAGMPLNSDGTVPGKPFQNLQDQIDAIEVPPGVLLGKGASAEEQFTADGEMYSITAGAAAEADSTRFIDIAFCVDENDIAITGTCIGNPDWSLSRAGIESNYDSNNFSRQICIWNKPLGDTSVAGAQVGCIKVPGP